MNSPYTEGEPPHAGLVLAQFLAVHGISQSQLAVATHQARPAMSHVLRGMANITPQIALRVAYVTGTSPEYWMELQSRWALWNARRHMVGTFQCMTKLPFAVAAERREQIKQEQEDEHE